MTLLVGVLLTTPSAIASGGELSFDKEQTVPDGEVSTTDASLETAIEQGGQEQAAIVPSTLHEFEPAATTVEEWMQDIAQTEPAEITDVQVEATEQGLTLRLDASGELAVSETSVTGNALVIDISNAVLRSPDGDEFFLDEPVDGIALVNITSSPDNQVRIAITGTDAPPVVNIETAASGLVADVTVGDPSASAGDDAIQIGVVGEQDDYFVPNASTATRTDTDILDIPQSVQVVPRRVLEDQQILRVDDALRNVSGVVGRLEPVSSGAVLSIRGFSTNAFNNGAILRDGFRIVDSLGSQETANIERIEVIKGPASVLYGQNDPGGVINLVTKRPLFDPTYEFQFQAGSFALIRPSADLSGPLTEDRSVRYRLNVSYQNEENGFRGFDTDLERFFIAPVVTWDISDRTRLTVLVEYTDEQNPFDLGLPALGDGVVDVPRDVRINEPDDFLKSRALTVGYDFEHKFSDSWTLNHGFRYVSQVYDSLTVLPVMFDETTGDIARIFADRRYHAFDYSAQTSITGKFNTGSVKHTLLAGVDLNFNRFDEQFTRIDFDNLSILNIFDPVYGVTRPDFDSLDAFAPADTRRNSVGVFLQDQIDITDNLIVVGSVRYDSVVSAGNLTGGNEQSNEAWSPRIGVIYQPTENLALYANYAQAFEPNGGTTASGEIFEPERSSGYEVGVKAEYGDFLATLAYFDITKRNVLTPDPNNPMFSITTGEQRSQGVELDIVGEILQGWNIIANYAYIDARITEDNTVEEGNRLFNAPRHSAALWTTYEIQSGSLQGLGFGLGFNYVGDRAGDNANTHEVDDYFLTNAAVFYERGDWQFRLNFNNIFDVKHITGTGNSRAFGKTVGAPFTVVGSISVRF
ncbi:MAG: TonB-dependent siderophore receptor [Cyanobacteria bacterium P01_C01_bin.89]